MRTRTLGCILGFCVVSIVFCSSSAFASVNAKFYLEGEVGASFVHLDSGGHNSIGPHDNTGDDSDTTVVPGVHFGAGLFSFLRADLGFNYRGNLDFTTNSFQPPTPTFFYKTKIDHTYTLMASLYFEPIHLNKWTPYIGAGVGSAWIGSRTNDTVVEGKGEETNFAWQAEAGIQRELTEHLTLKLGYRYIDMGPTKIPLSPIGTNVPGGSLKGTLTAQEVTVGLRYSF
jgi:opacity protein-like surface antigen